MIQGTNIKVHPVVFPVSATLIVVFVAIAVLFTDTLAAGVTALQHFIVSRFGWLYIVAVALFLLFVIFLFLSPYGKIRLGKDDELPQYSYASWFAMLFSAGMGIGLLFYGVAEPVLHFADPPLSQPGTVAAAREAMNLAFFHWGFHAWAVYIVVGLSLAYFSYRHDLPLTIRSALYPFLGDRINGPLGNIVDITAVFGTLFGVATSLGLGVMQVNAGLEYLGLAAVSTATQLWLILGITLIATASVVSGVGRGIRRLSELNMLAGLALLLFVFLAGPTVFLLSATVENVGRYLQSIVVASFRTTPYQGVEWQASWTMFYWGWWISWAPFVGMFIARVSRGRTIREFIGGVLFAPVLLTVFWFTVFGNTALHMELFGAGGMVEAVKDSVPTALFIMLDSLPWALVTSALATLMVGTFFVTSSDSGSLVIDIITSGGHPDPPVAQRIFWALTEGAVAAVLLLVGGLTALQTAAITTALPFSVVMAFMCAGLLKGLRAESHATRLRGPAAPPAALAVAGGTAAGGWKARLATVVGRKEAMDATARPHLDKVRGELQAMIAKTVVPAFEEITAELQALGREAKIDAGDFAATLRVINDGSEEFAYTVRGRARHPMTFAFPEMSTDAPWRAHAEIVVRGGVHKDMGPRRLSRDRLVRDFVDEYGKWMGW